MTNPRTCVLYLRLSDRDEDSTSLQRQEDDLRRLCDRRRLTVAHVLIDDGLSGRRERLKAAQALRMIDDHEADVLVVWKFDRWSRMGLSAVADLLKVLDNNPGSLFIAEQDGLSSDQPAFRIIAAVLSEVARTESENTKLRVKSSIAALRKSGRYAGGNKPYGYRSIPNPNGPGRVLEIDPLEAIEVQNAAESFLSGNSLYSIMNDLNERGILSRRKLRWNMDSLSPILTSDAISGYVVHHGDVIRDESTGLGIQIWPAVLDTETVRRIRAKIASQKPNGSIRRRQDSRLLSGLVFCSYCGTSMYPWQSSAKVPLTSYVCGGKGKGRICPSVTISATRLEDYVEQQFLRRCGNHEIYTVTQSSSHENEIADINVAITDTARQLTEDSSDTTNLVERLAILKDRRLELRSMPIVPTEIVGTGVTFREAWATGDRRDLLLANIVSVKIKKGTKGQRGPLKFGRATIEWHRLEMLENLTPADIENPLTFTASLFDM